MYTQPNYPQHQSDKIIQPESVLKNRQDLVMPLVQPKWPQFDPDKAKTKTLQLVVDSRDRNRKIYPDPNKYVLHLLDDFDNVTSIELIHAYIPTSGYNINESNNKLHISINGAENEILFNEGIYQIEDDTITETYLYNMINETITDNNIINLNITYSKLLNKSIFYTDFGKVNNLENISFNFYGGDFNYDNNLQQIDTNFKKNTIGYTLGFNSEDIAFKTNDTVTYNGTQIVGVSSEIKDLFPKHIIKLIKDGNNEVYVKLSTDTLNTIVKINYNNISLSNSVNVTFVHGEPLVQAINYTIHLPYVLSPRCVNLSEDPYILLHIRDLNIYDSRDKNSSKAFCKIPIEGEVNFDNLTGVGIIKKFGAPKRIDKLDIKFLRYNRQHGNSDLLYDFKGRDHVLTFAVTCTNYPYVG